MEIEWQLLVADDVVYGKGYVIHPNAKVHCFINGQSLCGKYYLVPGIFDTTTINDKDIRKNPEYFCKKCLRKYKLNDYTNCSKNVVEGEKEV